MVAQRGAAVAQRDDERLRVLLGQAQLLQLLPERLLGHVVPSAAQEDEMERGDRALDLVAFELAVAQQLRKLLLIHGSAARLHQHLLAQAQLQSCQCGQNPKTQNPKSPTDLYGKAHELLRLFDLNCR